MKKLILIIAGACLAVLLGGILGYRKGKSDAAVESFDTYRGDLVVYYGFPEFRKVQLQDFLKARYYYYANRVPTSYLESPYDYGNVDFEGLTVGKGPTSPQHEYQMFKDKKLLFKEPKFFSKEGSNSLKTNAPSELR